MKSVVRFALSHDLKLYLWVSYVGMWYGTILCYLWEDIEISNIEEGHSLHSWLIGL